MIRRMILESLGIEKYSDEHMNSTYNLLRVMKYEGPQTTDAKLGLHSHTDKKMVTILCQNEVNGLEVQTKDGKRQTALSGTLSHDERERGKVLGRTVLGSEGGCIVKAPEELVDEEHPLLFKPFHHLEFEGVLQH
ncbi:probable 2-oxoglutarate-dependent dioxygenase AOP1 [Rhodamnia argentea]|uniref:Probable 2-oxoglutarate-dependent dioxygenase AOP1 n=1 Tax=Rhodamnia argentea TaxID=178133 RepID=A0A8B8N294_9MYRT|nr:probable 2-oxoglutarate-dependent dioxygenase AOP1 [Rhodamnia argentea]